MAFGGIKPGDFRKILIYNKDRTYAFVMALGDVTDEWYANAAGCHQLGLPDHRGHADPRGAADGHLHVRARRLEYPACEHRGKGGRGQGP